MSSVPLNEGKKMYSQLQLGLGCIKVGAGTAGVLALWIRVLGCCNARERYLRKAKWGCVSAFLDPQNLLDW